MQETKESPAFTNLIDLAAEKFGGQVLYATDDFFAEKENLIKPGRGIFIVDKYTDRGKWMDGWESRRKRTPGHDFLILKLATPGKIQGFDIDTNHFLGNHPPFCSIEGLYTASEVSTEILLNSTEWEEILTKSPLQPGSQNFYSCQKNESVYSHLKLHIYPDGGVARLKVYGNVFIDWKSINPNETIDLAAASWGARALLCNDMFFSHMDNLIMPGRGVNMGDGWETKRNRTPNNSDWIIVKLAHVGTISRILIDTKHFKGNYPDSCKVEGLNITENQALITKENQQDLPWEEILLQSKLSADHEHFFEIKPNEKAYTHVKLTIFPDGGISRMRIFGNIKA